MKLFSFFLLLISFSAGAQSDNYRGMLDNLDERMTVTSEFTTSDFHFKHDNIYYPITTKRGVTYFVYVNAALRPVIGEIKNGQVTTEFLDKNESPVYRVQDDPHNLFGIGVDKNGYIHISGDMHNYSVSYPKSYYIDRYYGKHVMYWVSRNPYDISDFEFVGGDVNRAIPGNGFSYLSFITDRNGELYARYRTKSGIIGHTPGEIAWGLAHYKAESRSWQMLGEQIDNQTFMPNENGPFFNVVYWSPVGAGDGKWYQGFMSDVNFDFNNRMHTCAAITTDAQRENRHLMYAYSDDGGISFKRANNTPIDLPVSNYGNHWGDIVVGEGQFNAQPTLTFSKEGIPLISYENNEPGFFRGWTYFDKESGKWVSPQKALVWFARIRAYTDANGVITFPGGGNYAATRMFGIAKDYRPGAEYHWRTREYAGELYGHDSRSVTEQNVFRSFFTNESGTELQILRFKFTPIKYDPLPKEFLVVQCGQTEGEAGMLQDIFQLQSSGAGMHDDGFKGQYTSTIVSGNFSVSCRVIQMDYHQPQTFAGLAIADDAEAHSSFFGNVITWDGVETWYKQSESSAKGYDGSYNEPSEWLKIVRMNDTLKAYRSNNNITWTEIDRRVNFLNDSVYLGFVAGSGSGAEIGHARIDHYELIQDNQVTSSNNNDIKVFPNPSSIELTIDNPYLDRITNLQIYTANGALLWQEDYTNFYMSQRSISINNWVSGVYYIALQFENDVSITKIFNKI